MRRAAALAPGVRVPGVVGRGARGWPGAAACTARPAVRFFAAAAAAASPASPLRAAQTPEIDELVVAATASHVQARWRARREGAVAPCVGIHALSSAPRRARHQDASARMCEAHARGQYLLGNYYGRMREPTLL